VLKLAPCARDGGRLRLQRGLFALDVPRLRSNKPRERSLSLTLSVRASFFVSRESMRSCTEAAMSNKQALENPSKVTKDLDWSGSGTFLPGSNQQW
jgi:hypothetical protein